MRDVCTQKVLTRRSLAVPEETMNNGIVGSGAATHSLLCMYMAGRLCLRALNIQRMPLVGEGVFAMVN